MVAVRSRLGRIVAVSPVFRFPSPSPLPSPFCANDYFILAARAYRPCCSMLPPKRRSLAVAIVRKAEAPRELMEEQIDAQLPHLARVLTAGYRHQVG